MRQAGERQQADVARAVKFMAIKVAVFIGIPLVASIATVLILL